MNYMNRQKKCKICFDVSLMYIKILGLYEKKVYDMQSVSATTLYVLIFSIWKIIAVNDENGAWLKPHNLSNV